MAPEPADTDLRRQSGPHVFVDDLDVPTLSEGDHHHLAKALRVKDGDAITVCDGAGRWRTAAFGPMPVPVGPIIGVAAPQWPLRLACALTKASKPEIVVQKATELGVDEIVFFHGIRSIARWDDAKVAKSMGRLARVAREAAMQSRRVTLPVVRFVADAQALATEADWARADFGGEPIRGAHRSIAIGPEGGWDPAEPDLFPTAVDLGPSVLRAETAAIAATTLMAQHRHAARDR